MTDTEKDVLERRIDELCAEVEALKRDEWTAGFNAGCEAVEAAYEDGEAHYEAENVKLRAFCADMWEAIKTHKRINFAQLLRFGERVSELGIEAKS